MNHSPTVDDLARALRAWVADDMLPPLAGAVVWDIGCGWGGFTAALLAEGARHVHATDIVFDDQQIPAHLRADPRVSLQAGTVQELAPRIYAGEFGPAPTLLFMHLMTEHVADLGPFLRALATDLPAGCRVFVHHDNYYQPTGHHDHQFLSLDPGTYSVVPRTVPCWTRPERCEASAAHRATLVPWQWGEASKATVGGACDRCNYQRRSVPWAHLLYQGDFRAVWPEVMFAQAMNKATTFQVRQWLLEAGLTIVKERRTWVGNEPPEALLSAFTRQELKTFTITFSAVGAPATAEASALVGYRRY